MARFYMTLMLFAMVFSAFSQKNSFVEIGRESSVSAKNVSLTGFDVKFSYDTLTIFPSDNFVSVGLKGAFPSGKIGSPSLPVSRTAVAIPNCLDYRVVVKNYSVQEFDLSQFGGKIVPQQRPISKSDSNPQFDYDGKAYQIDAFVGGENGLAWISPIGTMRGVGIGELNVSPLSYNPVTNVLRVYNDIEIEVVFESVDFGTTEQNIRNAYSPFFGSAYSSLINKDIFDSYSDLYHTPVKMLVVAHEDFAEQLQPWLEWKTQKGFYLDVNYVNSTTATSANIMSWIQAHYSMGVEAGNAPVFLVLVGDVDRIPASAVGDESNQQTDLYYASVDGDYLPEMHCSRISVETPDELSVVVGKTLMYEKYKMPDPSYLGNALLIAGTDDTYNPYIAQPTINYAVQNYFNAEHGYSNVYAYLDSYNGCYNNLSTGVGYAHYTAHGGEQEWCGPNFTNDSIDNLANDNKYFLAIGNCCLSGKFGYSVPCYGEKMIRSQKKGAFAYIGSSPVTYWYEDYYWALGATTVFTQTPQMSETQTGAFDLMFDDRSFNTVSSVMYGGNLAVTNAFNENYTDMTPKYYWEAYNVLGDGSVMPYYSVPQANEVSHGDFINGMGFFTVEAHEDSYVAVTSGGTIIGTALVGAGGVANVPLAMAVDTDSVLLVVTRQQRIPYIEKIPVVAPESAYISLVGYSPDVVPYANTVGGYSFTMQLKNVGHQDSEAWLPAVLRCSDPNVEITDSVASCPPIVSGETVEVAPWFSFVPSASLADGYVLTFSITIDDTINNNTYISCFDVRVIRSVQQICSYSITGDAVPGGEFALSVSVTNVGTLAEPVEVILQSLSEHLFIDDLDEYYGEIARDSIVTRQFPMRADSGVQFGEALPVRVVVHNPNTFIVDTAYISIEPCNVSVHEFPYSEPFSGDNLPDCWSQVMTGSAGWEVVDSDPYDYYTTGSNGKFAFIHNYSWDKMSSLLVSSKFAFAEGLSATLSFRYMQKSWEGDFDVLSVYYKNSESGDWRQLAEYNRVAASWTRVSLNLPDLSQNYYIAFFADLNYGFGIGLDDVEIEIEGCVIPLISLSYENPEHPILTWTGNAESYTLYKNGVPLVDTENNTYELPVADFTGDCFEVVAHCGDGNVRSQPYCVTDVAGEALPQFEVYPNPASDRVEVVCAGMKSVAVYDALGRKMASVETDSDRVSLPLDGMSAGLYMVVVECAGGRLMKKLEIVQ